MKEKSKTKISQRITGIANAAKTNSSNNDKTVHSDEFAESESSESFSSTEFEDLKNKPKKRRKYTKKKLPSEDEKVFKIIN